MSRPKQDPTLRFMDVIDQMNYALEHQGAIINCRDDKHATYIMHRCNTYRQVTRDNNNGLTLLDMFVIRRRGTQVVIEPRPQIDPNNIYDVNGNPMGDEFRRWTKANRDRWAAHHGVANVDSMPDNPFTQDKPLKLDDE